MSGFRAVPRSGWGKAVAVLVLAALIFLVWKGAGNALGNIFGGAERVAKLQVSLDSVTLVLVQKTAQLDTLSLTLERKDTVLQAALAETERLRTRTGPIRWRTRVDTLGVVDTVTEVVIRGDTVGIPQEIAEEVESCRRLAVTCEDHRQVADSLRVRTRELLGAVAKKDTILEQIRHVNSWDLGLLRLPKPDVTCGLYGGYSLVGQSVTITGQGSAETTRWSGGVGCVLGFKVWGLR